MVHTTVTSVSSVTRSCTRWFDVLTAVESEVGYMSARERAGGTEGGEGGVSSGSRTSTRAARRRTLRRREEGERGDAHAVGPRSHSRPVVVTCAAAEPRGRMPHVLPNVSRSRCSSCLPCASMSDSTVSARPRREGGPSGELVDAPLRAPPPRSPSRPPRPSPAPPARPAASAHAACAPSGRAAHSTRRRSRAGAAAARLGAPARGGRAARRSCRGRSRTRPGRARRGRPARVEYPRPVSSPSRGRQTGRESERSAPWPRSTAARRPSASPSRRAQSRAATRPRRRRSRRPTRRRPAGPCRARSGRTGGWRRRRRRSGGLL